jgi:hypothetical protein
MDMRDRKQEVHRDMRDRKQEAWRLRGMIL